MTAPQTPLPPAGRPPAPAAARGYAGRHVLLPTGWPPPSADAEHRARRADRTDTGPDSTPSRGNRIADGWPTPRHPQPGLILPPPGAGELLHITELQGLPIGVLHRDAAVVLRRDALRLPGAAGAAPCLRLSPAAGTVRVISLVLCGGRLVLVERYRHATGGWEIEAPGGRGDPGDDAPTAARQAAEELGARVREILPLGTLRPDSELSAYGVDAFAVRVDGYRTMAPSVPGGGIRRVLGVPAGIAEVLICSGVITCALTIAAVARARASGLLDTAAGRPGSGRGAAGDRRDHPPEPGAGTRGRGR